jgi:choline dehydrogenase-like flavoprotein
MGHFLALAAALPLLLLSTVVASPNDGETYDFIIIGGGLTGLVAANRLSEDPKSKPPQLSMSPYEHSHRIESVLVIENGYIDNSPLTSVPYESWNLNVPDMWNITSAPEPFFKNATYAIRVGSVVGGGTIINGMAIDRATDADYDAWETLGNVGWGYKGLAPYLKKWSHFTPPSDTSKEAFHITYDASAYGNGPVQVTIPSYEYPDITTFLYSYRSANVTMPEEGFVNPLGAYWVPNDINNKTATRAHARISYYDPVQNRTNLKLLTGTRVNQILLDKNLVATGVQMVSRADGSVSKAYASKEVILAAGAVFSPHILMLSGIGPKDVLTAANVPVKVDAPGVGSNFQDHPILAMSFTLSNQTFPNQNTLFNNATFLAAADAQYAATREGPKSFGRAIAAAFLTFKQFSSNYLNITNQIKAQDPAKYLPATYRKNPTLLAGYIKQREILIKAYLGDNAAIGEIPIQAWGHNTLAYQKPLSRGTITLNTTNPEDMPIVQWNALTNPIEEQIFVEMVHYGRRHWTLPELARFSPVEAAPGAQYTTPEDIIQQSMSQGILNPTFSHPTCSCPMMPLALGGVVSDQLLVYGVKQLSIIDASIIPLIPATHLQATLYAIAEKASDLIKARCP